MEIFPRLFPKCRCRPLAVVALLCSFFAAAQGAESTPAAPPTVLFLGNSFTFGAGSPVRFFRPDSVVDLNNEGIGGVPALFNAFARQAGRNYAVSLETGPGKGIDFHVKEKAAVIARPWDFVVAHGYSTLDKDKSGDPALLIQSAKQLADLLVSQNPRVDIRLVATWSRADQTYPEKGHWHGQPIEKMALDLRAAYDRAAAGSSAFRAVIPVGEAWNRAMAAGVADPNPYDGIAAGQVDLWTYDHYHGSTFGYYLSALMIFGDLTGLDPRSLGGNERAAYELGLSASQAVALQKVAYDELTATQGRPALAAFKPVKLTR
ncbi:MAG: PEP-CTERM sorting domain-containing protein [Verrucomicrobia bacterium]|nr:PEP-CTERM sorting domain-containing protein [Verrucomicrobiota bacterium]